MKSNLRFSRVAKNPYSWQKTFALRIFVVALLCLLGSGEMMANYNVKVAGVYYYCDTETKTAMVTYPYYGHKPFSSDPYSYYYTFERPIGAVTILTDVLYKGAFYKVTSINDHAFDDCEGLTSIDIPNSVTSIGGFAFNGCTGITSINIPNSVTSIGVFAFGGCTGLTYITIPNSVTSIGLNAFYGTKWYSNQPNGMIYINNLVYEYKGTMPSNTSIVLRDGTMGIGSGAFDGCTGLTSITIPNSVTSMGNEVFIGCTGLTSITIPNSVTSMGNSVFRGCTGLTSIIIPNSVTTIGLDAFNNTKWYSNQPDGVIYINNIAYSYKGTMPSNTNLRLKDGTTSINSDAFEGRTGLTSITIPNSVTSIGTAAFNGCTSLTSVDIPSSVISIDANAFNETKLSAIAIPPSVTIWGEDVFGSYSTSTWIYLSAGSKTPKNFLNYKDRIAYYPTFSSSIDSIKIKMPIYNVKLKSAYYASSKGKVFATISSDSLTATFTDLDLKSHKVHYTYKWWDGRIYEGDSTLDAPTYNVSYDYSSTQKSCKITNITIPTEIEGAYTIKEKGVEFNNTAYKIGSTIAGLSTNLEFSCKPYIIYKSKEDDNDVKSYGKPKTFRTKDITVGLTNQYPTATSFSCKGSYDLGDAQFKSATFSDGVVDRSKTCMIRNLEPSSYHEISYTVETKDGYTKTFKYQFYTDAAKLTVKEADHLSSTTAQIHAIVNCDETANTGFEWRAFDAPDLVPSKIVSCPSVGGYLDLSVSGLSNSKYYKYRPFLISASGKTYLGDWIAFGTADAYVYFAPVAHTYAVSALSDKTATLFGKILAGSDDISEQGFEYWTTAGTAAAMARDSRATATDVKRVQASGSSVTYTLSDLQPGTTYYYRSYAKTAKETVYGEQQSFTTEWPVGIGTATAATFGLRLDCGKLIVAGLTHNATYRLVNLNGQLIATGALRADEGEQIVSLPQLSRGMYLIHVSSNGESKTLKVNY